MPRQILSVHCRRNLWICKVKRLNESKKRNFCTKKKYRSIFEKLRFFIAKTARPRYRLIRLKYERDHELRGVHLYSLDS